MNNRTAGGPAAIAILFLGFFVAFQLILRAQPFADPGALWHIRVGDWIFASQAFPRTDPFTWSHAGQFWIPQQWGAECLMAAIHRLAGFDGLLTAMNALLAATAAWICKRFIDGGLHPLPAAAVVGLGMATAGFHFYSRPHLATIVLTAVVMAWLVDYEQRRVGVGRMVWLIPLSVFWTNLHGGALGGIGTAGLATIGWFVIRDRGAQESALVALIVAGCLLATLINPFGTDMHKTWLRIVGSSAMKEYVPEHYPLSPWRTDGQAVLGFGVFYLFMLAGVAPRRWRVTWLIPIVWFILSLTGIRHGPLFVATALIALADLVPATRWFALLKKHGDTYAIEPREPRWIGWPTTLAVIAVIGVSWTLQAARVPAPIVGYDWARFDNKLVPVELIEPLQEYARSKPPRQPIFNDANVGGFVLYFAPSLTIFMDDRFELYGDQGLLDYADLIEKHPERIEKWRARAGFDRAIVEVDTKLDEYLKDPANGWTEIARCRKAALFAVAE